MRLRRVTSIAVIGIALLVGAVVASGALAGSSVSFTNNVNGSGFTVIDTIGTVPLTTQFSVFGSGGHSIGADPYTLSPGPTFTLSGPTTLTEVGGFVNNCGLIIGGIPYCPQTQPFVVEIHRMIDGQLDANIVARFPLSHDNEPLLVSYESATPNVTLSSGAYAALFAAQGADWGFVLGNASVPFSYTAASTEIAVIDGTHQYLSYIPFAVRIIGG